MWKGGDNIKRIKLILVGVMLVLVLSSCLADRTEEPLEIASSIMYEEEIQGENVQEYTKKLKNNEAVEKSDDNHGFDTDSFVSVDMETKKIMIPQEHISGVYKDIYSAREKCDNEVIRMLCKDINDSEIVGISIDYQEIIKNEKFEDYLQYPIVLETGCEEEYVAIGLLAQDDTGYYVQLKLTILADKLMNADSYTLGQLSDNRRYINCFVRSEELYHDVINFWGDRITVEDIQKPEQIAVSVQAGQEAEQTVYFTGTDAEKFTEGLLTEAYAVYDEHSFGITMTISMFDVNQIKLYYADDGCSMFQLDGVSYNLKPGGEVAAVMEKYIEKLEEKTDEKNK